MKKIENYPNPQFVRENTTILKENWLFSLDNENWVNINVPFCPESKLSGINHKGEINKCFYKTTFEITNNLKTIIHFGAVDYLCKLFINNKLVGTHLGGYTSFEFDISDLVHKGKNNLYLEVIDDDRWVPFGKQTYKDHTFGTFYSRTTGIWQDVYLEFSKENNIKSFKIYPNITEGSVTIDLNAVKYDDVSILVSFNDIVVGKYKGNGEKLIKINLSELHLWSNFSPNLYDLEINVGLDRVFSYFGMREVKYEGTKFLLNNNSVFQKLVLDQGFNQDGIYTSPSLEFMENDIKMSQKLGFNGARLHQKVFEPKYLYMCDKLGYLVWGEFPNWGVDYSKLDYLEPFKEQWQEEITRDFNHPSIITWCPFNEMWLDFRDPNLVPNGSFISSVFKFTKQLDKTRPVLDVSGGYHTNDSDFFDFHFYGSSEEIEKCLKKISSEGIIEVPALYYPGFDRKYRKGEPLNYSEFGGISFGHESAIAPTSGPQSMDGLDSGWGYGKAETDNKAFIERYRNMIYHIYKCEELSGFCYTQIYDVEQEHNGLYYYDRTPKLTEEEMMEIKSINDLK